MVRQLFFGLTVLGGVILLPGGAQGQNVLYVDAAAVGPTHDGASWCSAFATLDDALGAADASREKVEEIWVARGVYAIQEYDNTCAAVFPAGAGVTIRGGFGGCMAEERDEQDPIRFESVITFMVELPGAKYFPDERAETYRVVLPETGEETLFEGVSIPSFPGALPADVCGFLRSPLAPMMTVVYPYDVYVDCGLAEALPTHAPPLPPRVEGETGGARGADVRVNNPAGDVHPNETQNETTVAVEGDTVCVAYNDLFQGAAAAAQYTGFARSGDRGATFTDQGSPGLSLGDPVLAVDANGNFLLANMRDTTGNGNMDQIVVARSTDDCRTFGVLPFIVRQNASVDKPWIAVDRTGGANNGNVYVCWTEFNWNGTAWIPTIQSSRGIPFAAPVPIAVGTATNLVQGCQVAVGNNGEVHVAWEEGASTAQAGSIRIRTSVNGGAAFAGPVVVANLVAHADDPRFVDTCNPTVPPSSFFGGALWPQATPIRIQDFPSLAASPVNNDVYIVWNERIVPADTDIVFYRSTDDGATWAFTGIPHSVVDQDQFEPAVTVNPKGVIKVQWYDRRNDAANTNIDLYAAHSTDRGLTFTDMRVTDGFFGLDGFIPHSWSCYMGEYNGITADHRDFFHVWGDNRNRQAGHPPAPTGHLDPDVYFDKQDVPLHCGPGEHWVDSCAAGTDDFGSTQVLAAIDLDFGPFCVGETILIFDGPATIDRSDPRDDSANFPGSSPVDGHLDVIDTEIVSMQMVGGGGITLTAGAGLGQGGVLPPSLGAIVEQPGDSTKARSFFEVFFEIDLGGGQFLYNQTPVTVEVVLEKVPPKDKRYLHILDCVPLYDSPVPGEGMHIADLAHAQHCLGSPCEPKKHCGPGEHWVDECDAGVDVLQSTQVLAAIDLDEDPFCVGETILIFDGPVMITRSDPRDDSANFPGSCPVDGHLDCIDTEIVSMQMVGGGGITLTAGAGLGEDGLLPASLGAIVEQTGDSTKARSLFEVFFEVDMGDAEFLYNQTPVTVEVVLEKVPPKDKRYLHILDCVPLYDSPIPGTGLHVANLGHAQHCIGSPCEPKKHCGPGDHWVDECDAGVDAFESTQVLAGIDLDEDSFCVAETILVFDGAVVITRSDPMDDSANFPGSSPVDGHLDVIDTEMVSMQMVGGGSITLTAGAGLGQGGVLAPSLGLIVEQSGDSAVADSSFEVFFEIDIGGGQFLYNHTPVRVEAVLEKVPPKDKIYLHILACVPLYDSPIPGTGIHVANLGHAQHCIGSPCPDGACCDGTTGSCNDNVPAQECQGYQQEWFKNEWCDELYPPCAQHRGACCDTSESEAICTDYVLPGNCTGSGQEWYKGETCEDDPCFPTVSVWGMIVIALLLVTGMAIKFGPRPRTSKEA